MKSKQRQQISGIDKTEITIIAVLNAIIAIALYVLHPIAGVIGTVICGYLVYNAWLKEKEYATVAKRAIEEMNEDFDEVTKNAVFGMPFPMAVLNEEGSFLWYNVNFKRVFGIQESVLGQNFRVTFPDVEIKQLKQKTEIPFKIELDEKIYLFYHNITDGVNRDRLILLYGVDNTENENIRRDWFNQQPVIAQIYIDNYDDIRSKTAESDRPILFAQIDRAINEFAMAHDALLLKYESERYLLVTDRGMFAKMEKEKFRFVEQVHALKRGNGVVPTLSVGVALGASEPGNLIQEARSAMDIALSRGGDQVVIKEGENLRFFGGKNQATGRHNKVKARVVAHDIEKLIEECDKVFVMGHTNPDMDSFGACLGMHALVHFLKKPSFIVLDEVTPAIDNLYNKAVKEWEGLGECILDPQQAVAAATPSSLVIVLDNHRRFSTACPELVHEDAKVVIVDHHRRGRDYISSAVISYIEPSASSASELVTEILSYIGEKIKLPQVAAEGLLAGITVDTKNFFYQTGVRTFEAAALLKSQGADSIVIKQLFKDDYQLVRYRSEVIANARIFEHHTIIGRFDHEIEGSSLIASQAADDLLNIRGIDASFVLTRIPGKTHISARSLGAVSVQLIMERIGGGGHLTASATQLAMSPDEAEDQLKKAIREYFEEESDSEGNTD